MLTANQRRAIHATKLRALSASNAALDPAASARRDAVVRWGVLAFALLVMAVMLWAAVRS